MPFWKVAINDIICNQTGIILITSGASTFYGEHTGKSRGDSITVEHQDQSEKKSNNGTSTPKEGV